MPGKPAWTAGDARVGPYRILRLVNRGGQGSVYLGYDKRLHRRVAIKIYPLPRERAARKRLLQEAQVIASMQSPKVVQIHDVIESREHLAMVMEYVPGCDLEELLESVRPSLASVLRITADIAGALTVARQQRIVHGDLKARNVLITATGRAKLTDFGIARRPGVEGALAGSLSAMSPEQYLGKPLTERSDLFALGCLLYRMLGGVAPFCRDGQLDARALLEGEPAPLATLVAADVELAPELVGLVAAMLEKTPANRPSGTLVVRQVLRRVARGIPLAATNNLLAEARPCFRAESAEDIPPPVPADLAREGRSRMSAAAGTSTRWRWLHRVRWQRLAILAGLAGCAGMLYLLAAPQEQLRVHFEAPQVRLEADTRLPVEVSDRWLVEEVSGAIRERVGPLQVSGPIGATAVTTLYSDPARREPQEPPTEQLQLDLRCIDLLCVFAVSRSRDGRESNQQAVLFADMSVQQWRNVVRETTLALYP